MNDWHDGQRNLIICPPVDFEETQREKVPFDFDEIDR